MCADIMTAVEGCTCASMPASLRGFRRRPVRGETYPGIMPEQGAAVPGVVYFDLPDGAWARLDAFEGEMYQRTRVTVALDDGRELRAHAYVFRPAYATRLGTGDWDFETFLAQGKAQFMNRYLGFDRL
jgi:gamma-glutamylcyclotransferase (GGCT)/AIG2-like uncharacterized protein YtfP